MESIRMNNAMRARKNVRLISRRSTNGLGRQLRPLNTRSICKVLFLLIAQESDIDQRLDEPGESLVAQRTTNDSLGFENIVKLAEGSRIAIIRVNTDDFKRNRRTYRLG